MIDKNILVDTSYLKAELLYRLEKCIDEFKTENQTDWFVVVCGKCKQPFAIDRERLRKNGYYDCDEIKYCPFCGKFNEEL